MARPHATRKCPAEQAAVGQMVADSWLQDSQVGSHNCVPEPAQPEEGGSHQVEEKSKGVAYGVNFHRWPWLNFSSLQKEWRQINQGTTDLPFFLQYLVL